MADRTARVVIVGDAKSFLRAMATSNAAVKRFTENLATTGSATALGSAEMAASQAKFQAQMANAAKAAQKQMGKTSAEQQRVAATTAVSTKKGIKAYNDLGKAVAKTRQQIQLAKTQTDEHNLSVGRTVRGALAGAGAFTSLGRSIAYASASFLAFAVLSGGIRAVIASTAKFDQTLTKVIALAGGATKQVHAMGEELLHLAPKVGKTPTELAESLYFVASAGIPAAKQLEVVKLSAQGAAVGLGDTQTVADSLTSVLIAYAESGLTAANATNVLVNTVRFGKGEAADFAPVIGTVAAQAAILGIRFEEVGAALASLTLLTGNAVTASIQLQAFFKSLIKPGKEAEQVLTALHIPSDKLLADLSNPSKGLVTVLQEIKFAFEGNAKAIKTVFTDMRAFRAVTELVGEGAARTISIFEKMTDSSTALSIALAATSKDPAFRFAAFQAALEGLEITIGSALLPVVVKITKALTKFLASGENMKNLKQNIEGIASAGETLFTAFKDIAVPLAKLVNGAVTLVPVLGGWANALKLVIAVWAALKVQAILTLVRFKLVNNQLVEYTILGEMRKRAAIVGTAVTMQVAASRMAVSNTVAATESSAAWMRWARVVQTAAVEAGATVALAARGVGIAIKSAIASTGIGLLVVAVGEAAVQIMNHWGAVKSFLDDMWHRLVFLVKHSLDVIVAFAKVAGGLVATFLTMPLRSVLKKLSGLPSIFGRAASGALNALNAATIDQTRAGLRELEDLWKESGRRAGESFATSFRRVLKDVAVKEATKRFKPTFEPGGTAQFEIRPELLEERSRAEVEGTRTQQIAAEKAIKRFIRGLIDSATLSIPQLDAAYQALKDVKSRLAALQKVDFGIKPGLLLEQAKAAAVGSQAAQLLVSQKIRTYILGVIHSGKLAQAELIDAYNALGQVNSDIASAVKDAVLVPFSLQLEEAKAAALGTEKQQKQVAARIAAVIKKQIDSGKLHGEALKAAYEELARVREQAGKKEADAVKKHSDLLKQATDKIGEAIDSARSEIGELFQGPLLAPSERQQQLALGMKPPDVGVLTKDLTAQINLRSRFEKLLSQLTSKGAPAQLIKQLREKGTEALPELESLVKAKLPQLQKFFKQFEKGEGLAKKIALIELRAEKVNMVARNIALQLSKGELKKFVNQGLFPQRDLGDGGGRRGGGGGSATERSLMTRNIRAVSQTSRTFRTATMHAGHLTLGGRNLAATLAKLANNNDVIHVHVHLDGKQIAEVVTDRQQRTNRRSGSQRRGRHGGRTASG